MPIPDQRTTSRRALVRGAAWSVPVVTAVAAAPAFAASPCPKTALQPVTWSSTRTTTSQTGTTSSGTTVDVSASYTATMLGGGSLNSTNLTASTVAAANDAISLVNNSPTMMAVDGSTNYQTVNLVFARPVFGLTFAVDDIDRATGSYWDQVALSATPRRHPRPCSAEPSPGPGPSPALGAPPEARRTTPPTRASASPTATASSASRRCRSGSGRRTCR